MTDITKDIINESNYNLIKNFILNNISFAMILDNHNNWDYEFPERLKSQKRFIIDIKEQALEDSYIENDKIIIVIEIDNITYSKELEYADIFAIKEKADSEIPISTRPFAMAPKPIKREGNSFIFPSEEDIQSSMKMFKKYNPKLFKDNHE